jgi:hypothetical protein
MERLYLRQHKQRYRLLSDWFRLERVHLRLFWWIVFKLHQWVYVERYLMLPMLHILWRLLLLQRLFLERTDLRCSKLGMQL